MLDRNTLVHAVIWPQGPNAMVTLVDPDGVVASVVKVKEPLRGSDLAKMIPQGYGVETDACTVLSMSGELLVRTEGEFDTAVVTERAHVSFEERMARLERRERNNAKRQRRLEEENRLLRGQVRQELEQEALNQADDDPVPVVDTDKAEPQPEQEEATDA